MKVERAIWPAEPARQRCEELGITEAQLRHRYGIHVSWAKRPFLTTTTADMIACKVLRRHPADANLWGEAWFDTGDELDLELSYG